MRPDGSPELDHPLECSRVRSGLVAENARASVYIATRVGACDVHLHSSRAAEAGRLQRCVSGRCLLVQASISLSYQLKDRYECHAMAVGGLIFVAKILEGMRLIGRSINL